MKFINEETNMAFGECKLALDEFLIVQNTSKVKGGGSRYSSDDAENLNNYRKTLQLAMDRIDDDEVDPAAAVKEFIKLAENFIQSKYKGTLPEFEKYFNQFKAQVDALPDDTLKTKKRHSL